MNRLFLDANVLFTAAHNPTGKASLLFDCAARGHWTIVTSSQAVQEARHNLRLKYPECLSRLEMLCKAAMIAPTAAGTSCALDLPPKDIPIYLSAIHSKATHLITGDMRHFGPCMNEPARTEGVTIRTAASFFEQILT